MNAYSAANLALAPGDVPGDVIGNVPKTALVVDDSAFTRMVVQETLRACGVARVIEAADGVRALQCLTECCEGVDIVFCDLNMPGMDGIQFIRALAESRHRPSLVFMSGAAERMLRAAQAMAASGGLDVVGAIAKPIRRENVRGMLSSLKRAVAAPARDRNITVDAEQLAAGIARGEIDLHYQPKVSLLTGGLVGVEALARWRHPCHGLLMPEMFIRLAEKEGLMGRLAEAVTVKAVAQHAAWRRAGLNCKVAVNLSPTMITDSGFPDRIMALAALWRVAPSDLLFEVTESGMFSDDLVSMEILARLDMKGFALSIDDFGTGYSSMQQLQRLPFSELKIDRMFVTGVARDTLKQTVITSTIELARQLQMLVVVEGVEDAGDWEYVRAAGCDVAQGYFVARPMPADALAAWMEDWRGRMNLPAPPPACERQSACESDDSDGFDAELSYLT